MIDASLREIALALGGEVSGVQVLAPGPGHGPRDRSLSVKVSAQSPDGMLCHSFAGDDFRSCRDHVRSRLGMTPWEARGHNRAIQPIERATNHPSAAGDEKTRIERARKIWDASIDPRGTLAEAYLKSRALQLGDDIAGAVLRFNPRCPWGDKTTGKTIFVPAMIAAMRSIATDEITGIQRTLLPHVGAKPERRMLGIAAGACVKLDRDDTILAGLHVGEGAETCMSARQLGLKPTWALGSKDAIARLPVLGGVECLTILAENDDASAKAVRECGERWHATGRAVLINRSSFGKDLNDALKDHA